ncbi:MAG: FkbM family methyltransferase [Candidatus Bathyarchaeia archaeon]|jgi:FkbM family methyltransferase
MFDKIKAALEIKRQYGISVATKVSLNRLGVPTYVQVRYPMTSLSIRLENAPIIFWKTLEQKKWEPNLMRFINELVTPGETILEVGAWMGPLTFLLSHLTGPTGTVYAFEPMPHSFSLLKSGINNNRIKNVRLFNMAISDFIGSLMLHAPSSNSDLATSLEPEILVDPKTEKQKFTIKTTCKCTTIDAFCKEYAITPSGFKIDVEGAENNVFKGAIKTIEKTNPWCLLEFHGHLISESARRKTWTFIREHAGKILYIDGDETNLSYKQEVPSNFQPIRRGNYCVFFGS